MKRGVFLIIVCCYLISCISTANLYASPADTYGKKSSNKKKITIKKDPYPLSFYFLFYLSPTVFLYTPKSNYDVDFPFYAEAGLGFEYRFTNWFGIEGDLSAAVSFHYKRKEYEDIGCECPYEENRFYSLDMLQYTLGIHHLMSLKFYTPPVALKTKKKKGPDKMRVYFRLGTTLEGMILSNYFLFNNGDLYSSGSFMDDEDDGPNAYKEYLPYRDISNFLNIGPHFGIGLKFFKGPYVSLCPEIRYTFFTVPVLDGKKNGYSIKGNDAFIIRNNGSDDAELLDFKMTISLGLALAINSKLKYKTAHFTIENLNFYPNSPKLLPASFKKLQALGHRLRKMNVASIKIVGHAASIGLKQREMRLSILRAKVVCNYLIKIGAIKRIGTMYWGHGSNKPIATNKTDAGRKKNRRVELYIKY